MKLATVSYEGSVRHKRHRAPSGRVYRFNGTGVAISSLEDMRYFAGKPNYEVDANTVGLLAERYGDEIGEVKGGLKEMGYRQKQKIAKMAGISANQAEEDLEDALEDLAEQLKRDMENQ